MEGTTLVVVTIPKGKKHLPLPRPWVEIMMMMMTMELGMMIYPLLPHPPRKVVGVVPMARLVLCFW